MNDIQLYDYYLTLPLNKSFREDNALYPKYVKMIGHAEGCRNPHRHYTFAEFIDKLNEPESGLREHLLKHSEKNKC